MKKEKKPKKKLTPKEREEKKQNIKKLILGFVHVVSYILSFLFLTVCVIAACQGGCKPKKQSSNVTTPVVNPQQPLVSRAFNPTPKEESDNIIFYKSDIKSDVDYYLHLDFSNYNYLEYFLPNYDKLFYFDDYIYDWIRSSANEVYNIIPLYSNNDQSGFTFGSYTYHNLTLHASRTSYNLQIWYTTSNSQVMSSITIYTFSNLNVFTFNGNTIIDNSYNYSLFDLFDYLFTTDNVYFKIDTLTTANKVISQFLAYYLSNYSFDFNSYKFGGNDKYVSLTYLFRRIYNGFFIYCPNQTNVYLEQKLFSGVWEFQNTIYNDISIRLIRAWNGNIASDDPINEGLPLSARFTTYNVLYFNPNPNGNLFFPQIFNGDNKGLENYYFIDSIYMTGVDGQSFTLAYNRLSVYTDYLKLNSYCYPTQSLRIFQDDSFLLNNQTEFTLYSIDYDYRFTPNQTIFLTYNYYSDFFFTAFVYTGLYHTIKPGGNDNTTTIIITPVFDILSSALLGLLPLFNAQLLPNITFGVLILLPFVVSIILFVVKLFKR